MNNFSIQDEGVFWLPSNPEERIPGILTYNDQKFELKLFGHFNQYNQDIHLEEIILGHCKKNASLTLYRSLFYGIESSYTYDDSTGKRNALHISNYAPNYLLIGTHFEKSDDFKFDSFSVQYSTLNDWIQKSFYEHSDMDTIKIKKPERYFATLDQDTTLELYTGVGQEHFGRYEFKMIANSHFVIESKKTINLDEIYKKSRIISEFLLFATMEIPSIIELKAYSKIANQPYPKTVKIISRRNLLNDVNTRYGEKLIEFSEIEGNLDVLLKEWFLKRNELIPFFSHYFTTRFNPNLYIHTKFLNYIQSLEGYHRLRFINDEIPLKEHETRINEIIVAAPEYYRNWLSAKLIWSNEKILRTRLEEIFEEYDSITNELFKSRKKKNKFLDDVVRIRNDLTHLKPNFEQSANEASVLGEANKIFEIYIILCLLKELNLPIKYSNKLISNLKSIKSFTL
jgi:hypothetical protein